MNKTQFGIIANRFLRSQPVKNAAYAVLFEGETAAEAERDHAAPKGTVARAVKTIRREWSFIQTVNKVA